MDNNLVYKIVNTTNNKEYVGSTIHGLEWRKRKHLRELKKQVHHNRHLQNAYNLLGGPEKFNFVILEVLPTSENLLAREDYWTKLLKPAYNIMREIKSHIGVKRSPETCRRISEALRGRKLSPEHIESMRKTLTGRKQPKELAIKRTEHQHKPILQLNQDGTLVKEWKSATEAEHSGMFRRKCIYRCLWKSYGRKTYKGCVWEYKNEEKC